MTLKDIQSIKNKLSDSLSKMHQIPHGHIASLDVARFIAAFFIIIGHVDPFYVSVDYSKNAFIAAFAYIFVHVRRMGLAFFLLASGFLFGKSLNKGKLPLPYFVKIFKRLSVIFLGWSVFYLFEPFNRAHLMEDFTTYGILKSYYWYFLKIEPQPFLWMISGTKDHLWFLPSLMTSITIIVVFIFLKKERYLLLMAIIAYLFALCLFQVPKSFFVTHEYFKYFRSYCQGFGFVAFGWWLSRQTGFSIKDALKLVMLAMVIQIIQDLSLRHFYQLKPDSFLSIGLLPAVIGIFIMLICYPNSGKNTIFRRAGSMTLGIYLLHPLMLDILELLNRKIMLLSPAVRDLGFPVVIVIACLYLTKALSNNILLKKFIS